MKKKILLFLTLFMIGSSVYAKEENNSELLEKNYKIANLGTIVENKLKDHYGIKKIYEDKYPEFYGGMYISDDYDNIIIQIVKTKIPSKKSKDYNFYNSFISLDEKIKIEYVDNSFNELNEINNIMSNNINKDENVLGTYIDMLNNTVKVELDNMDIIKQEQTIKKIFDNNQKINSSLIIKSKKTPLLTFEKGEKAKLLESINSGGKLDTHQAVCSMGFRAKMNGRKGYVTAGHCLSYVNAPKHGTIRILQFQNNGYYDYGFVETNNDYNVTNKLEYPKGDVKSLAVVNYSPNIYVNLLVAKNGIKTGYTDGKVKGLNQTVNCGNVTIKGLVKTNLSADERDSGGVVFIPMTDSDGGSIPIGVVSSGKSLFGILNEMDFTSINDMYPISRY